MLTSALQMTPIWIISQSRSTKVAITISIWLIFLTRTFNPFFSFLLIFRHFHHEIFAKVIFTHNSFFEIELHYVQSLVQSSPDLQSLKDNYSGTIINNYYNYDYFGPETHYHPIPIYYHTSNSYYLRLFLN